MPSYCYANDNFTFIVMWLCLDFKASRSQKNYLYFFLIITFSPSIIWCSLHSLYFASKWRSLKIIHLHYCYYYLLHARSETLVGKRSLTQRLTGPDILTSAIIANLHTSVCFGECGGLHLCLRVKWEMLVYNFWQWITRSPFTLITRHCVSFSWWFIE